MSLQEIIESFRTGLMLTGLWVLAAIVAGCIGVWLYRSAQSTTALLRRLRTWIDGIVFTLLFTACVLIGGTKTNSPPMGLMVPLPPSLPQSVVQTVTDEDIARGYREVAETNCEASVYAMPEGITPSFNWHRRGTLLGVMELYATATDIQGFFTNAVFNGHLDHDADAGAFRPLSVNADNTVGTGDNIFFALNNAFLPYLRYGTFKLEIPVVWYVRNESVTNRLVVLEARNTVYANADVTVSKYLISVTRGTNDVFTISR